VTIREVEPHGQYRRFEVRCDCGTVKIVRLGDMRSGSTVSCGCWRDEKAVADATIHGERFTPEYEAWAQMNSRCSNPNHRQWHRYGGRGIKVCDEWKDDFLAFLAHAGKRPSPEHSIDRIDNDGDYRPGNVRWATRKEQCRNKGNNTWINYKGERRLVIDVCEELGLSYQAIMKRRSTCVPDDLLFV
jgi:hypothetical protein